MAEGPRGDTIYLRDREMITGEVKELRLGILTVDTKNIGIVDIKISHIETLNTLDSFRIETADQMLYYGTLEAAKPGYVYITSPSYIRLIEIDHINTLAPVERKVVKRLQGNASAGFTYTRSSRIGQLSLNSNIYYTNRDFDQSLSASGIATIDSSAFSFDRADFSLASYYNVKSNNKWYLVGGVDYQRNMQLSIARRFQETLGGGRKFILTPGAQILGILGVSLNEELSTEGNESLLVEIPLGFVFNFFQFSDPDMQITSKNAFYTSLSQKGRVRYESNTSFTWEIIHNFAFSWTFYFSYDRKPPDPDAGKVDYGTTVSLTYKF